MLIVLFFFSNCLTRIKIVQYYIGNLHLQFEERNKREKNQVTTKYCILTIFAMQNGVHNLVFIMFSCTGFLYFSPVKDMTVMHQCWSGMQAHTVLTENKKKFNRML